MLTPGPPQMTTPRCGFGDGEEMVHVIPVSIPSYMGSETIETKQMPVCQTHFMAIAQATNTVRDAQAAALAVQQAPAGATVVIVPDEVPVPNDPMAGD